MTHCSKIYLYSLITLQMAFILWLAGFYVFVEDMRTPPPISTATNHKDISTAIVLTGGKDRLNTGFSLLKNKEIDSLFISGVYHSVSTTELLNLWEAGNENLAKNITLGYQARDTHNNAVEAGQWLDNEKSSAFFLITSGYHMKRALLEFKTMYPQSTIVPLPVTSSRFNINYWWHNLNDRHLIIGEYNKYLITRLKLAL